jgi:hypothetical protein
MDDFNYYVSLLTDRLERLQQVITTDHVEAVFELSFLEKSAFDCVKKCLDLSMTQDQMSQIAELCNRIDAMITCLEGRLIELETKLKHVTQTARTIRKYTSSSSSDGLISKCV